MSAQFNELKTEKYIPGPMTTFPSKSITMNEKL